MLTKTNAGYTIIAERNDFRGGTVVLGMRRQPDGYDYVTWLSDGEAYFWGNYFDKANGHIFADAVQDFQNRA